MVSTMGCHTLASLGAALLASAAGSPPALAQTGRMQSWKLATARRTGIHDLAPAPDGGVWFTAQTSGHLGRFDPASGRTELLALGSCSAPHGVVEGPDKAAWITDGGQNAIVRVAWPERSLRRFPLPAATSPAGRWRQWKLPGDGPRAYAVYVDERDMIWVSDFGGNACWSFDPRSERFERYAFPRESANVRQILGRPGEVWLPESGTEHISVIRTG